MELKRENVRQPSWTANSTISSTVSTVFLVKHVAGPARHAGRDQVAVALDRPPPRARLAAEMVVLVR
jgi:hypothetical protein